MGAQRKFDYDGADFYTAIGNLASRDYNDCEIARFIGEEIRRIVEERNNEKIDAATEDGLATIELEDVESIPDEGLAPEVFSRMKKGQYDGWTEQENRLRSMLICQVLSRARVRQSLLYKEVYNMVASGRWKTKTTQSTERKTVSRDGVPYAETITTTTEQELPPNMQAISVWRFHHDPEFRKTLQQMKKMDVSVEDKSIGKINVNVVYNKKEDTELQEQKR